MGFSADGRATFLALMSHLGPEGDPDEVVAFVRDHWAEAMQEVGAHPGWDQVRAGLLRILPRLLEDQARAQALDGAAAALDAYPQDVASGDPALLLARHPAWVGLAVLELAAALGEPITDTELSRAIRLAAPGFRASGGDGGDGGIGRGEILWAMGEQAEEVGWLDRARQLLRAASTGPFADPHSAHHVRLLLGLRLVEDGDPEGVDLLEALGADDEADDRSRVHALWVVAAVERERGHPDAARAALQRAHGLALVAEDEDSDVVSRIASALADLDDAEA